MKEFVLDLLTDALSLVGLAVAQFAYKLDFGRCLLARSRRPARTSPEETWHGWESIKLYSLSETNFDTHSLKLGLQTEEDNGTRWR